MSATPGEPERYEEDSTHMWSTVRVQYRTPEGEERYVEVHNPDFKALYGVERDTLYRGGELTEEQAQRMAETLLEQGSKPIRRPLKE